MFLEWIKANIVPVFRFTPLEGPRCGKVDWFEREGPPLRVLHPYPPIIKSAPPVPPAPSPQPAKPSGPKLSNLLAVVDTYEGESGFGGWGGSAISKAKDLLVAVYESPDKLRQVLAGLSSAGLRDDAVASFLRTLFESGPEGTP